MKSRVTTQSHGTGHCQSYEYGMWVMSKQSTKLYSQMAHLSVEGDSGAAFEYSNIRKTSLEVVGNYGKSGALVTAGYERARGSGYGTRFSLAAGQDVRRDAEQAFEWRRWNKYCVTEDADKRYSGRYEWRPYRALGEFRKAPTAEKKFTCYTKNRVALQDVDSLWVSQNREAVWHFATQAWGFSLNTKQFNDVSHKYVFWPRTGETALLCGNTNVPIWAKKVREFEYE